MLLGLAYSNITLCHNAIHIYTHTINVLLYGCIAYPSDVDDVLKTLNKLGKTNRKRKK